MGRHCGAGLFLSRALDRAGLCRAYHAPFDRMIVSFGRDRRFAATPAPSRDFVSPHD